MGDKLLAQVFSVGPLMGVDSISKPVVSIFCLYDLPSRIYIILPIGSILLINRIYEEGVFIEFVVFREHMSGMEEEIRKRLTNCKDG
ncbi:unnamed protein product [Malus baccata var. baccata]